MAFGSHQGGHDTIILLPLKWVASVRWHARPRGNSTPGGGRWRWRRRRQHHSISELNWTRADEPLQIVYAIDSTPTREPRFLRHLRPEDSGWCVTNTTKGAILYTFSDEANSGLITGLISILGILFRYNYEMGHGRFHNSRLINLALIDLDLFLKK